MKVLSPKSQWPGCLAHAKMQNGWALVLNRKTRHMPCLVGARCLALGRRLPVSSCVAVRCGAGRGGAGRAGRGWCGVVWRGTVRCGVVRCGAGRAGGGGLVWCGVVWFGVGRVVWGGVVRLGANCWHWGGPRGATQWWTFTQRAVHSQQRRSVLRDPVTTRHGRPCTLKGTAIPCRTGGALSPSVQALANVCRPRDVQQPEFCGRQVLPEASVPHLPEPREGEHGRLLPAVCGGEWRCDAACHPWHWSGAQDTMTKSRPTSEKARLQMGCALVNVQIQGRPGTGFLWAGVKYTRAPKPKLDR